MSTPLPVAGSDLSPPGLMMVHDSPDWACMRTYILCCVCWYAGRMLHSRQGCCSAVAPLCAAGKAGATSVCSAPCKEATAVQLSAHLEVVLCLDLLFEHWLKHLVHLQATRPHLSTCHSKDCHEGHWCAREGIMSSAQSALEALLSGAWLSTVLEHLLGGRVLAVTHAYAGHQDELLGALLHRCVDDVDIALLTQLSENCPRHCLPCPGSRHAKLLASAQRAACA